MLSEAKHLCSFARDRSLKIGPIFFASLRMTFMRQLVVKDHQFHFEKPKTYFALPGSQTLFVPVKIGPPA